MLRLHWSPVYQWYCKTQPRFSFQDWSSWQLSAKALLELSEAQGHAPSWRQPTPVAGWYRSIKAQAFSFKVGQFCRACSAPDLSLRWLRFVLRRACMLGCFGCVQLFVTVWTLARQAPLSVRFSRQESWSGLPFPPPGHEIALQLNSFLCTILCMLLSHSVDWPSHSVTQCPTLCDSMDYSLPGSSVHGIFPARILEWVAISSFKGSFWSKDRTHVS